MHTLNFNDVPDLSYTKAFVTIDEALLHALVKLPETSERARCAAKFCFGIVSDHDKEVFLRQGYMRASLAEFVGMEEALPRDLQKLGISAPAVKTNSGQKPLLHIVRELRNFEIHLQSSLLSSEKRSVLWGHYQRPQEATPLDVQIWTIDDLTEARFRTLKNAKHYQPADVPALVAWFNAAQKEWGVHDLILRAVEEFCREIIATYSL